MKKVFLGAMLIAGTTFGFAKDNVKPTNENSTKVENVIEKNVQIFEFDSIEEAQKFLEECTDITAAYTMIEGELELVSVCESTHPCIVQPEGQTRLVVVIV